MAQNGFKHIAVTMPEDEDEVIVAGLPNVQAADVVASDDEGETAGLDTPGVADREELDVSGAADQNSPDALDAPETLPAPEPAAAPKRTPRAASPEKRAADRGKQEKSGYQQPTLEDLKGEPMSMTQKIVIIAAVVCIIGAIIYYFVFMR